MGAGFVLLMILVAMLLISAVIAVIAVIVAAIISRKDNRKRMIILAAISPFLFSISLFFIGLASSIAVSGITGVDLGIGDTWYLPLDKNYKIVMIDTTESGYIESEDGQNVSLVSIQQRGEKIFGLTDTNRYFSINLTNKQLTQYETEKEFYEREKLQNNDVNLEPLSDFYYRRSGELAGNWMIAAQIASVAISASIVFVFCRMVLYGASLGFNRKL